MSNGVRLDCPPILGQFDWAPLPSSLTGLASGRQCAVKTRCRGGLYLRGGDKGNSDRRSWWVEGSCLGSLVGSIHSPTGQVFPRSPYIVARRRVTGFLFRLFSRTFTRVTLRWPEPQAAHGLGRSRSKVSPAQAAMQPDPQGLLITLRSTHHVESRT